MTPLTSVSGSAADVAPPRHPWFPISTCDAGCIGAHPSVSPVRMLGRILRFGVTALGLLAVGSAMVVAPRPVRRRFARMAARALLASLGIALQIDDRRPYAGRGAGLIVANHTSFLDILAVAAVIPARFVAKAELLTWPGVGTLARRVGVIGLRRESLRDLPDTIAAMVDRLHRDDAVGVFPEGTTYCGRTAGTFTPATFEAAVTARSSVIPMHVGYHCADGDVCTQASFIGGDDLLDTMRRVIRSAGLTVRVRVHETQLPGEDRRALAARCERLVFASANEHVTTDTGAGGTRTVGSVTEHPSVVIDHAELRLAG
ncbi:1-acyl-sn-glycerol-3-phosphate acyltransferase [Williamsia sp. CHRR-6]|uniref:lysophospholipid acyltransferase family protein n=1 Tax=Williamsia sp. CHRR-6 TaxID=2835871 RepID=UPI001BDAFA7E|nr:lysophospholipid acyltransferase family protein [Williamsia sp. CHRR-6]MBT0565469.1 1-acyl-sn-glycerol-3-phosphate acyltransferase [Williamsia sp. CHRR-6]